MNGNQAHAKGQRDELLPPSGARTALERRWGKQQGAVPAGWVLRYISLAWALRLNKGTGTDFGSCLPDHLDLSTCMSWKGR